MTTMRAVLVEAPGGADQLRLGEAPRPEPGAGEVRVRVHATALNRADLLQRQGQYPPPPGASEILGLEAAGIIEAVGEGVDGGRLGARVMALLPGGGYAEYVTLPARMAIPIPENLTLEEAAAVPEVFLTAYQALHWLGAVEAGQRVLVHAGASGVGTAAIQLARAAAATVYVTASAPKHEACLALGAEAAIDYRTEDFAERIADLTGGAGVHVILDFIGASYFDQNLAALGTDGRLVLLAMMGGTTVEQVNLARLFRKRIHLITTLRSRSVDYKIRLTEAFSADALPRFKTGVLRPVIDSVRDWTEVRAAHRHMEANRNVGKIVLTIP